MEPYSFYSDKFNWSEEILATAIIASAGLNIWAIFASPGTDSTIGAIMLFLSVLLFVYCGLLYMGTAQATPSISVFLGVMVLGMSTNGLNMLMCSTSQKTLGR